MSFSPDRNFNTPQPGSITSPNSSGNIINHPATDSVPPAEDGAALPLSESSEDISTFELFDSEATREIYWTRSLIDNVVASTQRDQVKSVPEESDQDVSAHTQNSKSELEDNMRCMICLKTYGKRATVLPCGHEFDYICIQIWIADRGPAATQCPYCRGGITHLRLANDYGQPRTEGADDEQFILEPVSRPMGHADVVVQYPHIAYEELHLRTDAGYVTMWRSISLQLKQQSLGATRTSVFKSLKFEIREDATDDREGIQFKKPDEESARALEKAKKEVGDFITKWESGNHSNSFGIRENKGKETTIFTTEEISDGGPVVVGLEESIESLIGTDDRGLNGPHLVEIEVDTSLYEIDLIRDGGDRTFPHSRLGGRSAEDLENENSIRCTVSEFGGILQWFDRIWPNQPGRERLDPAFTYILEPYDGSEPCNYCSAVHRHGKCLLPW